MRIFIFFNLMTVFLSRDDIFPRRAGFGGPLTMQFATSFSHAWHWWNAFLMSAISSIESCVWCNLQKQNERKLQTIFGKTVVRCGLRQVLYGSLIFFCTKTGVISLENGPLTLIQILKLTNKVYRNVRVCNVLRCPWGSPRFDWFKVLHSAAGQFGLCYFHLLPCFLAGAPSLYCIVGMPIKGYYGLKCGIHSVRRHSVLGRFTWPWYLTLRKTDKDCLTSWHI